MESSDVVTGTKAKLLSRTFPPTAGRCLTFWYHMYGSGMGELNVYVKPVTGTLRKVSSLSGDQGDAWNMAQVTLISSTSEYQVKTTLVLGRAFPGSFSNPNGMVRDYLGICRLVFVILRQSVFVVAPFCASGFLFR